MVERRLRHDRPIARQDRPNYEAEQDPNNGPPPDQSDEGDDGLEDLPELEDANCEACARADA
jgi:hypothetical protein